jgi:hypothetical protein
MPLSLPLGLWSTALAGVVDLDGVTHAALLPPTAEVRRAEAAVVARREVTLRSVDGGTEVDATWWIHHLDARDATYTLWSQAAHPGAITVDGVPAPSRDDGGATALVRGAGWFEVRSRAYFPEDASLSLLPATTGVVRAPDDDRDVVGDGAVVLRVGLDHLTGAHTLTFADPAPRGASDADYVVATTAVGVTVGEDAVSGAARVSWVMWSGERSELSMRVDGVGADLDVRGPGVADWRRDGDVVRVTLAEPSDAAAVDLTWSRALTGAAEEALTVPRVEPLDVTRVDAYVQLARDGEIEVSPALDAGWTPIPRSSLPESASGLVTGQPIAAFRAPRVGGGRVDVLRFEPLSGPPVVVDVADWRLATTEDGRALVRGFLEVRNDRASHLRVTPPPGVKLVAVRVQGQPSLPVTDDGRTWLVPLVRSLETVEGLLSFPVEVTLLGEGAGWERRVDREVRLPAVDAPVALARTSLVLPTGYRHRGDVGADDVVSGFDTQTDGISYGFAVGSTGAAQADALFQDAVGAWLANDFETAEHNLSTLREMGAESENIDRLQSNVDVVYGRDDEVDEVAARRVKKQAAARAVEQQREMEDLERTAEELSRSGNYSASTQVYQRALDIGNTLTLLSEDTEEQDARNEAIAQEISAVEDRRASLLAIDGDGWVEPDVGELPWDVSDATLPWDVPTGGELPWDVSGSQYGFGGLGARGSGMGGGGSAEGYGIGYGAVGSMDPAVALQSREFMAVTGTAASSRRRGGVSFGSRKSAAEPPMDVAASELAVTIPVTGEIVRFQSMLLPAGAGHGVRVVARSSHPRSSR